MPLRPWRRTRGNLCVHYHRGSHGCLNPQWRPSSAIITRCHAQISSAKHQQRDTNFMEHFCSEVSILGYQIKLMEINLPVGLSRLQTYPSALHHHL